MIGSGGTGINNRSAYGIFTSVDPEEYALGIYGDVCLEINLDQFKVDSGLDMLNLSFEPEVEDYLVRSYIQSSLGLEENNLVSSDISLLTVIVQHRIPVKYIKQMN